MGRQNIQFRGIRHAPSDITAQDGDLLDCVNLVHENGELKPIQMPEQMEVDGINPKDSSKHTLAAVHNLTDGNKFVFTRYYLYKSYILVKNEANQVVYEHDITNEEIKWVDTIGNTLIIGTDKSTHYALYKNGAYKWLGDKLPQPVFEFSTTTLGDTHNSYLNIYAPNPPCEYKSGNNYHDMPGGHIPIDADNSQSPAVYADIQTITDTNKTAIRDNLRSKMAELLNTSKKEGRFIYPFFVRYAIEMFDESHVMHSAPVLMLPSTMYCPIAAYLNMSYSSSGEYQGYYANIVLKYWARALKMCFKGFVDENGASAQIGDWEDVIKGVDVCLSSQFVTYNESYYDNIDNVPVRWYWCQDDTSYNYSLFPNYGSAYSGNTKEDILTGHKNSGIFPATSVTPNACFPIESYPVEHIQEKIKNNNLFYKVKHYDLNKLESIQNQDKYLHEEIEYGSIERLETLPILEDDYVSRSRMTGKANYNYNQRLVLGDISLQAPKWYYDAKTYGSDVLNADIIFKVEKPEKTIYIGWSKNNLGRYDFGHYLFYPDPDCKEAVVRVSAGSIAMATIPMSEHTGLHGSYALMPDLESLYEAFQDNSFVNYAGVMPQESSDQDRYYKQPNVIAMSGVANPFYFPASNFKDIGRAKVIGIAANVLDTAYEQWGPYPLFAFCSDGIVSITIDKEGKFGGVDAVSADVLLEPKGISQPTLIQANRILMFLTQRGVMSISGTKPAPMSLMMDGRHFVTKDELEGSDWDLGNFGTMVRESSTNDDFKTYLQSSFLAYDYAHNRVLLVHPYRSYQYVLSLDSLMWSKQMVLTNGRYQQFDNGFDPNHVGNETWQFSPSAEYMEMQAVVNNYTELYLQGYDNSLYKAMDVTSENVEKALYQYGYFVSRPVRFGTDEYKSITRLLHRYTHFADQSFVRLVLYGSRDGVKYGRMNTLRGMSYKFFIFVVYTYLKPNERYSYLTVDFEPRMTNKLR